MQRIVLSVLHVTKRFVGRTAVENLSFEVREGEVLARFGPDEGRIEFRVQDGDRRSASERVSYLPEARGLHRDIAVLRTLVHFGRLRGMEHGDAEARAGVARTRGAARPDRRSRRRVVDNLWSATTPRTRTARGGRCARMGRSVATRRG